MLTALMEIIMRRTTFFGPVAAGLLLSSFGSLSASEAGVRYKIRLSPINDKEVVEVCLPERGEHGVAFNIDSEYTLKAFYLNADLDEHLKDSTKRRDPNTFAPLRDKAPVPTKEQFSIPTQLADKIEDLAKAQAESKRQTAAMHQNRQFNKLLL